MHSPHNSLCLHRRRICQQGVWPWLTAVQWHFQRDPVNLPELPHPSGWGTDEDPVSASEDSLCLFLPFTGLAGPQGESLPVQHLALQPTLSIWGSWKAVGAGTQSLYPATPDSARSSYAGPKILPGEVPFLLASGLCRTGVPGPDWVPEQNPGVWAVTSSLLLLLTLGKLPGNTHSSLLVSSPYTLTSCSF